MFFSWFESKRLEHFRKRRALQLRFSPYEKDFRFPLGETLFIPPFIVIFSTLIVPISFYPLQGVCSGFFPELFPTSFPICPFFLYHQKGLLGFPEVCSCPGPAHWPFFAPFHPWSVGLPIGYTVITRRSDWAGILVLSVGSFESVFGALTSFAFARITRVSARFSRGCCAPIRIEIYFQFDSCQSFVDTSVGALHPSLSADFPMRFPEKVPL